MTTSTNGSSVPVAIVGMSVLLPGASDLETYWHNLVNGVDAISDTPPHRWDPSFYEPDSYVGPVRPDRVYCRRGGFVEEPEIDVLRFGITPMSVQGTEPDQLIALKVAAEAIDDAGGEHRLPDRSRVGVVLGRSGNSAPAMIRLSDRVRGVNQLLRLLGEALPDLDEAAVEQIRRAYGSQLGPSRPENAIGVVPNLAASRIANRLDLRGPAYTVDAACASSLIAVDHAISELARGRCDVVLTGGVHHCHDITFWSVFSQIRALSPSQQIRPLDRTADGTLVGEGTGVVVLKRLADAERDGDRIYAVIRGVGIASDGRAASLVNPDPGAQVRAIRQAWHDAGLDPTAPGALGLLEAHGTATPTGDAAELASLARGFGAPAGEEPPVIGAVKSMLGHTMAAAGIASLVKAALAIHHGVLPPTLHCSDPHPALARTRFRPIDAARPWELGETQQVRRAGINSFGFGGINAHVVLEQPPGPASAPGPAFVGPPHRDGVREVGGGAGAGPAGRSLAVRLDLGTALVSLDDRGRDALRRAVRGVRPPAAPVAAPAGSAPVVSAPPVTVSAPPASTAPPAALRETRFVLRVSTDSMPYLRDHALIPQREDWPDESDRWITVPATASLAHMMEAAGLVITGRRAVAVEQVRLQQWLEAVPAQNVEVTVVPTGPDRARVNLGEYCDATVELAGEYPAERPTAWWADPATERTPPHTAAQIYRERIMFHGPGYQGVSELTAVGAQHVRGVITTPPAPGALLDNVGQFLGYWSHVSLPRRRWVIPARIRKIRFFGPHPAAGTRLDCLVAVRAVTDTTLEADMQLAVGGVVWAQIDGWLARRFENPPLTEGGEGQPGHLMVSTDHAGGWVSVHETWSDLASRSLMMRIHLNAAERDEYEQCPPPARRHWLLGRIAAKDAVRRWLWDSGEDTVYPAEIRVSSDAAGRPRVARLHGHGLPDLDVSLAHKGEAAVAIVRPRPPAGSPSDGYGTGIDLEEVTEHPPSMYAIAFTDAELRLIAAEAARTGETREVWATRFWSAKEAAAKAEGTGLEGRPRRFAVRVVDVDTLVVDVLTDARRPGQRSYRVRHAELANPEGLAGRRYVVAWTEGAAPHS